MNDFTVESCLVVRKEKKHCIPAISMRGNEHEHKRFCTGGADQEAAGGDQADARQPGALQAHHGLPNYSFFPASDARFDITYVFESIVT